MNNRHVGTRSENWRDSEIEEGSSFDTRGEPQPTLGSCLGPCPPRRLSVPPKGINSRRDPWSSYLFWSPSCLRETPTPSGVKWRVEVSSTAGRSGPGHFRSNRISSAFVLPSGPSPVSGPFTVSTESLGPKRSMKSRVVFRWKSLLGVDKRVRTPGVWGWKVVSSSE